MSQTSKVLLTFSLFILIAVGGLWIYGGKKTTYQTRLTIAAPPSTVFPYLVDVERHREWMVGLVDLQSVEMQEDVLGTTYRVVMEQGGTPIGFDNEIIRHVADESLSIRSSNATVSNTVVFKLALLKSGSTELTHRYHVNNVGLGRLMNIFLQSADQQEIIAEQARRLKALVEQQFKKSFPVDRGARDDPRDGSTEATERQETSEDSSGATPDSGQSPDESASGDDDPS